MATVYAEFVGRDLRVRWAENPDNVGADSYEIRYECDTDTVAHLVKASDFQSEDGSGIRQYADTLTYSENVAAGLTRVVTVTLKVRGADGIFADVSEWMSVVASNPAPVLTATPLVTSTLDGVDIRIIEPSDSDLMGYRVHMGTSAGFTPSGTGVPGNGTCVYDGISPTFSLPIPDDTVRYFKIETRDAFGYAGVYYTGTTVTAGRLNLDTLVGGTATVVSIESAIAAAQGDISDLEATYGSTASAAASAASASQSASDAAQAEADAIIAQGAAQSARDTAITQANNAASSASNASTSATNAATQASNAATSAANAIIAEGNAETAESNATTQAGNASTSASNAATSATNASGSASTASTHASNAATSATNAGNSASAANTSAGSASTSATNAGNSATASQSARVAAESARDAASGSASAASTSASNASTSATNAGNSASAASTSATNASTSAGQASTSATNASNSATTASGHASNASTSAGAAATSATNAGNSATAAAGSASTASTQATNAGNSATAANASSVSAASSYTNTVIVGGNFHFVDGLTGWTAAGGTYAATHNGRADVVTFPASGNRIARNLRRITVNTSRTYRVTAELYAGAGTGNALSYTGVKCFDATGTYVGERYCASSGVALTPNAGWTTQTGTITGIGGTAATFPTGTVAVELFCYTNDNGAAMATALNYVIIEDITESNAAATSASAAATSASGAATSATNAGTSASAASTSATNASTSAGTASTHATNASNSATSAAGSANTATTQAGLAATSATNAGNSATSANTSAGNASTSATNAGNSATAANASQVAAASSYNSVIQITRNGNFDQGTAGWTDGNTLTTEATNSGRSNILKSPTAGYNGTLISQAVPVTAGANYRLSAGFRMLSGIGSATFYIGLFFYNASGTQIGGSDGTGNYPLGPAATFSVANGWQDRTVLVGPGAPSSPYGGTTTFPAGTASVRLCFYFNYGSIADAVCGIDYFTLEPATAEVNAANSATAAATSASAASTSASAAGSSATSANTSATNASTSAGTASTQATNASNSATTASGHATNASNSATAAATSATNASNSASAASGSASTASTHATNAGNSATAANASQVAAASSYTNTVLVGGNQYFDQGMTGWAVEAGVTPYHSAEYGGRPSVAYVAAGQSSQYFGTKRFPVDTSRKYKVSAEIHAGAGSGQTQFYVGLRAHAADGSILYSSPGSYMYCAMTGEYFNANSGWHRRDSLTTHGQPITGEGTGSWTIFPVGTKSVSLLVLHNYNNGPCDAAINYVTFEDITESQAALSSANAAATSASNASTSASAAGSSASAAASSATAASTSASSAGTFATNSSNSASGAAGSASAAASSASTAGNHATTANTAAATATTQASNASTSAASASSSASLSATVSNRSLMQGSSFTAFSANGVPAGWSDWTNGYGLSVAGEAGGFAYQNTAGAGAEAGLYQDSAMDTVLGSGHYVVEAKVRLDAGTLTGAGVLGYGNDSTNWTEYSLGMYFPTYADVNGNVIGNGVVGRTYSFSRLVQVNANTRSIRLYAMNHYSGLGSIAASNKMTWFLCSVRPATPAEITAGVAYPATAATVATHASVLADTGNLNASWAVETAVPGAATFISARSRSAPGATPTSDVGIGAKTINLYNSAGADWKLAMSVEGGNAKFTGNLAAGGKITQGSGAGWPIALATKDFSVTDGTVVAFGTTLDTLPNLTFGTDGLAIPDYAAGEAYQLYADSLSTTGFTTRLKISTPATPSAYSLGPAVTGTGGPALMITRTGNDTVTGVYTLTLSGNMRYVVPVGYQGDITNTIVAKIWSMKSGVWSDAGSITITRTLESADNIDGPIPQVINVAWTESDTINLGYAVEKVGESVRSAPSGCTITGFPTLAWTGAGAPAGTRTATPSSQTTIVTVRPKS